MSLDYLPARTVAEEPGKHKSALCMKMNVPQYSLLSEKETSGTGKEDIMHNKEKYLVQLIMIVDIAMKLIAIRSDSGQYRFPINGRVSRADF